MSLSGLSTEIDLMIIGFLQAPDCFSLALTSKYYGQLALLRLSGPVHVYKSSAAALSKLAYKLLKDREFRKRLRGVTFIDQPETPEAISMAVLARPKFDMGDLIKTIQKSRRTLGDYRQRNLALAILACQWDALVAFVLSLTPQIEEISLCSQAGLPNTTMMFDDADSDSRGLTPPSPLAEQVHYVQRNHFTEYATLKTKGLKSLKIHDDLNRPRITPWIWLNVAWALVNAGKLHTLDLQGDYFEKYRGDFRRYLLKLASYGKLRTVRLSVHMLLARPSSPSDLRDILPSSIVEVEIYIFEYQKPWGRLRPPMKTFMECYEAGESPCLESVTMSFIVKSDRTHTPHRLDRDVRAIRKEVEARNVKFRTSTTVLAPIDEEDK